VTGGASTARIPQGGFVAPAPVSVDDRKVSHRLKCSTTLPAKVEAITDAVECAAIKKRNPLAAKDEQRHKRLPQAVVAHYLPDLQCEPTIAGTEIDHLDVRFKAVCGNNAGGGGPQGLRAPECRLFRATQEIPPACLSCARMAMTEPAIDIS